MLLVNIVPFDATYCAVGDCHAFHVSGDIEGKGEQGKTVELEAPNKKKNKKRKHGAVLADMEVTDEYGEQIMKVSTSYFLHLLVN